MNFGQSIKSYINNQYNALFTRTVTGRYEYSINSFSDLARLFTGGSLSNIEIAQDHPILTPALLFVSNLFSQAKFTIKNTNTDKVITNHPLLDLLNNPNPYMTRSDFFESLLFMAISNGVAILYKKKVIGLDEPTALYLLNPDLIEFPKNFKTSMINGNGRQAEALKNKKVKYDRKGENLDIRIGDLLFFYDMPNMIDKNFYKVKSRLDGLKQTLINTKDSLVAKNIILKTNGKELISGDSGGQKGFPLNPEEKQRLEKKFNLGYGLSRLRSRAIFTKASINYKSLHIALRDLGLDESVKIDGNMIYTALQIPKDILSLEAKKTTYNNFKESMVSYIQNQMQSKADSVAAVFQPMLDKPYLKLEASYEHLPVMQFFLMQRYEALSKKALALRDLLEVGIPEKDALMEVGFDSNMKLNPMQSRTNAETEDQSSSSQTGQGQTDPEDDPEQD